MKIRYGFISNSSSTSFVVAVDKDKNKSDVKASFKIETDINEFVYERIDSKEDLDEKFSDKWMRDENGILYKSDQERYDKFLKLIRSGKSLMFCCAASDEGEGPIQAYVRNNGVKIIKWSDGAKVVEVREG